MLVNIARVRVLLVIEQWHPIETVDETLKNTAAKVLVVVSVQEKEWTGPIDVLRWRQLWAAFDYGSQRWLHDASCTPGRHAWHEVHPTYWVERHEPAFGSIH